MEILPHLSNTFVFRGLQPLQLEQVAQFSSLKKVRKGETIFYDGDSADAFYALAHGRIKVYKLSVNGDEHILHIIQKPGDLFAEAAIYDLETFPANCQALVDSEVIRISKDGFISFILENPKVSLLALAAYSRRIRELVKITEELVFHDVKSRLASHILENRMTKNGQMIYVRNGSKKELAAYLGTIPETLSRALAFLKSKEIISERKRTMTVLDPCRLRTFAD
ncbi:MAG: hypothetical protein B6244_06775 [Candidatus Cloacimonetes bacterium 4572_55]|nr:MAG: hypothetical protein B6244_06775 [Candidatus Cloacimonetes bacterium 4572_55]